MFTEGTLTRSQADYLNYICDKIDSLGQINGIAPYSIQWCGNIPAVTGPDQNFIPVNITGYSAPFYNGNLQTYTSGGFRTDNNPLVTFNYIQEMNGLVITDFPYQTDCIATVFDEVYGQIYEFASVPKPELTVENAIGTSIVSDVLTLQFASSSGAAYSADSAWTITNPNANLANVNINDCSGLVCGIVNVNDQNLGFGTKTVQALGFNSVASSGNSDPVFSLSSNTVCLNSRVNGAGNANLAILNGALTIASGNSNTGYYAGLSYNSPSNPNCLYLGDYAGFGFQSNLIIGAEANINIGSYAAVGAVLTQGAFCAVGGYWTGNGTSSTGMGTQGATGTDSIGNEFICGINTQIGSSGSTSLAVGSTTISAGSSYGILYQSNTGTLSQLVLTSGQIPVGGSLGGQTLSGDATMSSGGVVTVSGVNGHNALTINTGSGLSGGGSVSLGGSLTLTATGSLPSGQDSWLLRSNSSVATFQPFSVSVVQTASTSNVNLAAPGATIGGVTLISGYRVLLTGQSVASQNGVWVWQSATTAMVRPNDYPSGASFSML